MRNKKRLPAYWKGDASNKIVTSSHAALFNLRAMAKIQEKVVNIFRLKISFRQSDTLILDNSS